MAFEMGTLKGFPNPPAMVRHARRWQSRRAPHAIGRSAFFCLLSATLLGGACADFGRGPAPDAAPDGAALVDDPVFENDVYPILQARCQDCHSKGGSGEYSSFVLTGDAKADRARIVNLVSPSFPEGSLLLLRATGYDHLGGSHLSQDESEYAIIQDWIAGLPRSTCP